MMTEQNACNVGQTVCEISAVLAWISRRDESFYLCLENA